MVWIRPYPISLSSPYDWQHSKWRRNQFVSSSVRKTTLHQGPTPFHSQVLDTRNAILSHRNLFSRERSEFEAIRIDYRVEMRPILILRKSILTKARRLIRVGAERNMSLHSKGFHQYEMPHDISLVVGERVEPSII